MGSNSDQREEGEDSELEEEEPLTIRQDPPDLGLRPADTPLPPAPQGNQGGRWPSTMLVLGSPPTPEHEAAPATVRKAPSSSSSPSPSTPTPPPSSSSGGRIIPTPIISITDAPIRLPDLAPETVPRESPRKPSAREPITAPLPAAGRPAEPRPAPAQEMRPPVQPAAGVSAAKRRSGDSRFFSHDDDERWLDRYELISEIASGGMATVFLGRLQGAGGFQRLVAIKRLHAQLAEDPEFVDMFLAEARIASQIHHTNAVPILEIGSSDRGYYLVMEYIEGVTLAQLNQRVQQSELPVPRRIALRIMLDALAGLHAAHELTDEAGKPLGLVHRDCSPQNIIIGVDGTTRLVDFGVARATTRLSNTRIGTLKGKVAYMAPEQIKQSKLDRRADIFAMGVILWECLAARPLFRADTKLDTILAALNAPVPRLSEVTFGVPVELEDVCVKALARAVDQRFKTAVEMADAIEAAGRASIATSREVASFLLKLFGRDFNERRTAIRAWADEAAARGPAKQPVTSPSQGRIQSKPAFRPQDTMPLQPAELPSFESQPESAPQIRQYVGSLAPMQLDAEEPLVAPKLKPALAARPTGPITAGALSATANPPISGSSVPSGSPLGAPGSAFPTMASPGSTPARTPRPMGPPILDPAPRPVLFSHVGEPAEKGSSLRIALIVGGLAAAATIAVMLLLTRPSTPNPPAPEVTPSASVVTPPTTQPPPSAVNLPTSASPEASSAPSASAAPPLPSASISPPFGSSLRPRLLGSGKPALGPPGDPYR